MKLIHSRIPRTETTVTPVGSLLRGYKVKFEKYQAVVPEAVADVLLATGDFYTDAGAVGDAVQGAKVLVVRDKGLGDVLMTTPLIRKLATEKAATVDVLTEDVYRCLFVDNPHVNETFALDAMSEWHEALLFREYDVVLDLRLVVENAEALGENKHRADAFAAYADITLTDAERRPDVFLEDCEREATRHYRDDILTPESGRKGVIGYVWASTTSNRNWSDETHLSVIQALEAAGYGVLIMGDKSIGIGNWIPACTLAKHAPVVDLMGDLTLREAVAVMSHCDAVITPDTGLFHVAAALDLPTLTYFGAFPIDERSAHTKLSVINDATRCNISPCRSYRCFNRDLFGQPVCLMVSGQWVVTKLEELLGHDDEPSGPAVARGEADGTAPADNEILDNLQRGGRGNRKPEPNGEADHPLPDSAV